jgi:hypothetical protein
MPYKDKELGKLKKREYYRKNKEHLNKACSERYKRNLSKERIYRRTSYLRKQWNITQEDYLKLAKLQNNQCAICNCGPSVNKKGREISFHIDHCHKTGKIRKLLCANCNRSLGYLKECPNILRKMIKYIEDFSKEEVYEN